MGMKKLSIIAAVALSVMAPVYAQQKPMTREIKVISSAGARALADACSVWAEQNKQTVAIAILDWGGNLIESHAMEGAPMNAIDTALLKAKSALRWRRPTSETNKMVRSGENLAPTFMHDFPQPGALPIVVNGQVIGAMGVSGADGRNARKRRSKQCLKGKQVRPGGSTSLLYEPNGAVELGFVPLRCPPTGATRRPALGIVEFKSAASHRPTSARRRG
jgi:glc operon protein GlcG